MKISLVLPPSSFLWKCQGAATPVRGVQITARLNLESQQPRVSPLSPRKKREKIAIHHAKARKNEGDRSLHFVLFLHTCCCQRPPRRRSQGRTGTPQWSTCRLSFCNLFWYAGNLWKKANVQFTYCTFVTATTKEKLFNRSSCTSRK